MNQILYNASYNARKNRIMIAILVLLIVAVVCLSTIFAINNKSNENIIKNVFASGIDISLKSQEDAKEMLGSKIKEYGNIKLVLNLGGQDYNIVANDIGFHATNIDALQDLSFLLIIFFIVIAWFNVNKGFLLNLPSKEKPRVVHQEDLIRCNLNKNEELVLNGKVVSIDELSKFVSEKKKLWPNLTFLLLINPDATYQSVIDVIYMVRQQKVENFSFRME